MHQRRVLVTDWDETATVKDTTALVALVAYSYATDNIPPFSHFVDIYLNASREYNASCATTCGARDTVDRELEYQRGMKAVEWASIGALEKSKLFQGLLLSAFADRASDVELSPSFIDFVRELRAEDVPVIVLSVNWSRTLIQAALRLHGIEHVTVLANDLEVVDGITTGNFDRTIDIRTGLDKLEKIETIRQVHPDAALVYVGDSSTDVLATLAADTGIVISGGSGKRYYKSLYGELKSLQTYRKLRAGVYEGTWEELRKVWFNA